MLTSCGISISMAMLAGGESISIEVNDFCDFGETRFSLLSERDPFDETSFDVNFRRFDTEIRKTFSDRKLKKL